MSSTHLASGKNPHKGNLAGAWDILSGASGEYVDLGIARRLGTASAAYSLRDIGATNKAVVRVRRSPHDSDGAINDEATFSAHQIQSGTLENWVNGHYENTLPCDVAAAAAAYSLRKVKASYDGFVVRVRRASDDSVADVSFDSEDTISNDSLVTIVSGIATESTLGDFMAGTDVFVQTWYDQSGNDNHATQSTPIQQPRIAEVGVLLSDGVSFANTVFMQANTSDTTVEASYFSVFTKGTNTATDLRPVGFKEKNVSGTNTFAFAIDNSLRFDGAAATNSTQSLPAELFLSSSFKISNSAAQNYINGVLNIDNSSLTLNNTDVVFNLGYAGSSTVDSRYDYDGNIKEAIFYVSDQSDNRFLIESNINNYYGLYADSNETSDSAWVSASAPSSFSSNSVDSFSMSTSTSLGLATLKLKSKLRNGNSVYVSFMANLDPNNSGTPATPSLQLRKNARTGTVTIDSSISVVEGFNSWELTSNDNDTEYIVFTEGDDNVDFTVTNFRISKTQRRGYVQTWYDQSGNGKDASQSTASDQPIVIENGGIVREKQGKPAIQFSTNSEFLNLNSTNLQALFAVLSTGNVSNDEQVIVANSSVNNKYVRFLSSGANYKVNVKRETPELTYSDIASADQDTGIVLAYNRSNSNNNTVHINNASSAITAGTDTDLNADIDINRIGARNSAIDPFAGKMQELIVYDSDKAAERIQIQRDMANHYGITLS